MTFLIDVKKLATLAGHTGSIYSLAYSGHRKLLSGSGDGLVVSWDIDRPDEGEIVARIQGIIYSMIVMENKLLVGQALGGLHVINLTNRVEERLLQYHNSGIFNILYVPQHQLIFSLAGDGMMGILDAGSLTLKHILKLGTGKLRSAAVNPEHNLLAVGASDGSIYTFSLPDLKLVKHWQAHQQGFSVNAVQFSPDGKFLLSGSRDAHLNVFDVKNDFNLSHSIAAHNYAIYSIEYSPDEKLFATGSRDKTVKIWEAETFEVLHRIDKEKNDGHVNSVNKIIWMDQSDPRFQIPSSKGSLLATAGDDRSVMIWEIATQ